MFTPVIVRTLTLAIILLCTWGCSPNGPDSLPYGRCVSCHTMTMDSNHDMKCTTCHKGIDSANEKDRAHQGLVTFPASPENLNTYCSPCHQQLIPSTTNSLHFTLSNSSNIFRQAYGANSSLSSFTKTPVTSNPTTPLELADNLLRKRCYKCHLYDSGQKYPATSHGQGCAACHFSMKDMKKNNHVFSSPTDESCLSCHYGNYVGFDYYGRFEQDYNNEYRTPFTTRNEYFRPYGVEYRQLSADIHQQKGLACVDCHFATELMLGETKLSCEGCHDSALLEKTLPENVRKTADGYFLTSQSGASHPIPLLRHPAHFDLTEKISCQACHAQWSFDDREKHFIRIDSDEFDSFSALTVQGNYEVESLLTNNFDFDKDELPSQMTDTLTGQATPGVWLKGYLERRWEDVKLGRNKYGEITVVRPLLDYSLSWLDEEDDVIFDSIRPSSSTTLLQEYIPHTTGSAGLFYKVRIQNFLNQEKESNNLSTAPPHLQ